MGLKTAGAVVTAEIEEPAAAGDSRAAQLERELSIRDREERAARREMARVTERLMRRIPGRACRAGTCTRGGRRCA